MTNITPDAVAQVDAPTLAVHSELDPRPADAAECLADLRGDCARLRHSAPRAQFAVFAAVAIALISDARLEAAAEPNAQPLFDGKSFAGWKGDLFAYNLDATSGALLSTPVWSAQSNLDARDLSTSPRILYTYNDDDGVLFNWASINTAMKDDLRTNPDTSVSTDALAQSRMAFIAGDRSNEGVGDNFRTRESRLGDIVHSAPKFVGAPEQNYPDADPFGSTAARYSTYKNSTTYQNRSYP